MLYFYIMNNPDVKNRCKVGITKNPDQRIKAYQTANPSCYFSYLIEIDNKVHEKLIIDILKDVFFTSREYIYGHPEIVENIISGYFDDLTNKPI